ncbi:hypothetical protein FJ419_28000 [Mesorhizobium sp. B2-6-2]|nr:hypothetical protein FJ419_28000 [Mesorhizobium sp. B2-6-2]
MAGRVRNLLNRNGRYFARLVIPKELRPYMDGRTELRTALGPDYRTALKALPGDSRSPFRVTSAGMGR